MKSFFQEFCDKVISLDKSIRFAAIADEDGKLVATSERKGLKPILTACPTPRKAWITSQWGNIGRLTRHFYR